jgi:hypothetical protein
MTSQWPEIVAHYNELAATRSEFRPLAELAHFISSGPISSGLFGTVSLVGLCITQTSISDPFDGPYLRISPAPVDKIEFRYVDTRVRSQQWHRVVNGSEAQRQLTTFLRQLHWFPPEVLSR